MSGSNDAPPEGWDAQAVPPSSLEIADEALAGHLGRRASRPAPRALAASIMARVDETVPERRWRLALAAWRPRMAMAGSGVALLLVVALLAINAMPAPVGTDHPSPPPTAAGPPPSGPIWDPTVRALTPPEFLQILAARPAVGTTLIVDDQIAQVLATCLKDIDCANGRLVNAGVPVGPPHGGTLPFDQGSPIPGPLALQVTQLGLIFLGGVVSNGTRLEFTARDLAQRNAMGGLFVIPAWIHRGAVVPCPTIVAPHAPPPTSELGLPAPEIATCSGGVYLTDTDPGPAPYGIGGGDSNAFQVQQEAYQLFASDPTGDGTASRGVFLVRDWAGYGEVLAGLQPMGIPTVDASGPPIGNSWDPTKRPLSPLELDRIIAKQPPVGTVLIVDDQIVELALPCTKEQACPAGKLVNTGLPVRAPVGGRLPFGAASEIPGPVALQVTEASKLVFLGSVARHGPTMGFTVNDLIVSGARDALYVVPGWLWRAAAMPCPTGRTTPPPSPVSELGLPAPEHNICAGGNYLTDDAPTLPPTVAPSDWFLVQNGAYPTYAPFPDESNSARMADYLVRDWGGYGEVVARLQPIEVPTPPSVSTGPTTEPTTPASPASHVMPVDEFVGRVLDGSLSAGALVAADIPASAVTVLSPTAAGGPENPNRSRWAIAAGGGTIRVDGVAKDAITQIAGTQAFLVEPSSAVRALGPVTTDGATPTGLFIVHAWLRMGPAVPCPLRAPPLKGAPPLPTGILGQAMAWSQCPGMWIVPSAVDPWAGPPNNLRAPDGSGSITIGDRSALPAGTLHVQDAAGDMLGSGPKEGDWLVRLALRNTCPPGAFCALVLSDRPALGVSWYELVGPITAPTPDSVEQRPPPTAAP